MPHPEHFPLSDLAAQALLIHAWGIVSGSGWNLPSWSMSMEFLAYLAFPALIFGLIRYGLWLLVTLSALLLMAYFLLPYGDMGLSGIARVLSEFSTGMVLCQLTQNRHMRYLKSDVATSVAFIAIIILGNIVGPRVSGNELDQLIVFPAALLVFSLDRDRFQFLGIMKTRPLVYLGKISYSLYATHAFVLLVAYRIVRNQPMTDMLKLLFCLLVPIVFAAATYHLVEHPCRLRLLRTLKAGKERESVAV